MAYEKLFSFFHLHHMSLISHVIVLRINITTTGRPCNYMMLNAEKKRKKKKTNDDY